MTRTALRQIMNDLEDALTHIACAELETPILEREVRRQLDLAQQRLDDIPELVIWHDHVARLPETMGNIFRADTTGAQMLCATCHRYWAPAGKQHCARCVPPAPYVPREYTAEERNMQQQVTEAIIQGRHQQVPSKP